MNSPWRVILTVLAFEATCKVSAQTSGSADEIWKALMTFGQPSASANFVDQANELRAFYTQYPTHPYVGEAKRREILALSRAALAGVIDHDQRRLSLLQDVRADTSLPDYRRFEAVAMSLQVGVHRSQHANRTAFLTAQENLTKTLVDEFPNVQDGYESLVAIARESQPNSGTRIATSVADSPNASADLRAEARIVIERFALLGTPIRPLFEGSEVVVLLGQSASKPLVIYTWTKSTPQALAAISKLRRIQPNVSLIGVCLDYDVQGAREAASTASLPGLQYYDARGNDSPLAKALKVGRGLIIYVVDRNGVLRDVQGRTDLNHKLSLL